MTSSLRTVNRPVFFVPLDLPVLLKPKDTMRLFGCPFVDLCFEGPRTDCWLCLGWFVLVGVLCFAPGRCLIRLIGYVALADRT